MHSLVDFTMGALSFLVLFMVVFYALPGVSRTNGRVERARLDVAENLGFSCHTSSDANEALLKTLLDFSSFLRKDNAQITLSLHKHAADADIIVCDYQFTTGLPHPRIFHKATVLIFRSDRLELPSFSLHASTMLGRLLDHILSRSINVAGHFLFSKRYLFHGPDEEALAEAFNAPVLRLLEDMRPVNLEGRGDTLIMYRLSGVVPSDRLGAFIQEGQKLFESFANT